MKYPPNGGFFITRKYSEYQYLQIQTADPRVGGLVSSNTRQM
jgi:hypothetical protein